MKKNCPRCSEKEFEVPNYNIEQKKLFTELRKENKIVELTQKLQSIPNIEIIDAKFSLMHINKEYGKCNRCKVDYLEEEYVVCPKCKSLNFNWKL